MNEIVVASYLKCRAGYSPDRVVADPDLNLRFQELCRLDLPEVAAVDANRCLLNARKAGLLAGIKTTNRTSFSNEDDYRYAAEIAVRFLEKRDDTTLDEIICDPGQAMEFDSIASGICPGYSPLEYRWAALNLRKSSGLKPERMSHIVRPTGVRLGPISELEQDDLPNSQGLYIFYGGSETLYVGESGNLKSRLKKHLDHSDNKELARWFWKNGFSDVNLEVQELPVETNQKIRKALESELIATRHPLFNVQRPS